MTQLPSISMLGVGNMSGAILASLIESPSAPSEPVRITTRSQASADRYTDVPAVAATALEHHPDANRAAARDAAIVVLGVKPQQLPELLDEIAADLQPGAVVVSVAAGISADTIAAHLGDDVRVVRAMPNTPATVGLGVTGIAAGPGADADAMDLARRLFEPSGTVVEVPESEIPAVGAVTGSGPAHVFLLIEAMTDAAQRLGFDRDAATEMVIDTFRGSLALLEAEPDAGAAELRRRVTSPKGTTEQSVAVLQAANLGEVFADAFAANIRRSDELAGPR